MLGSRQTSTVPIEGLVPGLPEILKPTCSSTLHKKMEYNPDVLAHVCNARTQETKAENLP